jgi:hypothetical protein
MLNRSTVSPKAIILLGIIGWIGCAAVLIADLVGIILVERHNPVADTVSQLAIGEYAWIQDLGLDLFALAVLAIAVGLFLLRSGDWKWKVGLLLLILLAVDVVLIAEHNQYAGQQNQKGDIHMYCVYVLYGLFGLACLLLAPGLKRLGKQWFSVSMGIGLSWFALGPVFLLVPDRWDGAYERGVTLLMVGWVVMVAYLLTTTRRDHIT